MLVPCPSCRRHVFTDERSCPHCGSTGSRFGAAVALAASIVAISCSSEKPPAAQESNTPTKTATTATTTTTAAVSLPTIATNPPRVEVEVYGPAPVDPSARVVPSHSASATQSATPKPPAPPIAVYGPPPKKPTDRQ